ncbi:MAG TPA: hypothetical protein VGS22_00875 [Thermoanaerobaculia bacterium]|nr:hypothetical protein [Thermoanaerobaculia bacterium]
MPGRIHIDIVLDMDIHKKTLNLDQARVSRVRELLGASTDTGAIHMALDWVLESEAVVDDLMVVAGKGIGKFRQVGHSAPKKAK